MQLLKLDKTIAFIIRIILRREKEDGTVSVVNLTLMKYRKHEGSTIHAPVAIIAPRSISYTNRNV